MFRTRQTTVPLVLAVLAAGVLAGWAMARAADRADDDEHLFEQYDRFIEVVRLVQGKYVRDVDVEELFEDAIKGMLSGLDPFSNYILEEEVDQFDKVTRGRFSGVGIQIGMRRGLLTVISPLEGTPAYRAGALAGDVILEIDGDSTDGITLGDAVRKITGEAGTDVVLTVRHLTGETEKIAITREIIEIHTVKGLERDEEDRWVWMVDPEKKIGYIRVTAFVDSTVEELREVIDGLLDDGMKGLVLDLRFNPGGQLQIAIDMVDLFISKGVVVQTKGRTPPYYEARATSDGTVPRFPLVVLVNPFSASASEIVAGALQDHGRAILVGERTFGKGSVQNVIPLRNSDARLKLTTSKYYLPNGRNIHREEDMTDEDEWGVVPDIAVPMAAEDYVALVRARQEAEVIQGNGPEAPAEEGAEAPETPETPGAGEESPAPPGAPGAAPPEDAEETEEKPGPDRQLERALDLLRSLEVLERYLQRQAV